jgi:hypothetical protein
MLDQKAHQFVIISCKRAENILVIKVLRVGHLKVSTLVDYWVIRPYLKTSLTLWIFLVLIKDLWLQMDGIATKCDFPKYYYEGWPWHFKRIEDIITKFKWQGFQFIRTNRKKNDGSGITPSYFPPHELGHFWPFSTIQSQGIELTKTLLFILKVLWCSNNLMQKRLL